MYSIVKRKHIQAFLFFPIVSLIFETLGMLDRTFIRNSSYQKEDVRKMIYPSGIEPLQFTVVLQFTVIHCAVAP